MNISELRKLMIEAKKTNKERGLILSMLLDKTMKVAKEDKNRDVVDSDIENAAKAMLKQAQQSKEAGMDVEFEISILSEFLPKVLSEEETISIVNKLKVELNNSIPDIMKTLKSTYGNSIDMKLVSSIVKK